MQLGRCEVKNFGSYRELSFDFCGSGLSLIYGATGSGKSTIMDMACWILYGVTAKEGGIDEVRSWAGTGDTVGSLEVDGVTVVRIRGKKNDLYINDHGTEVRGKDITETQKVIEARFGVSRDLFLSGAYFHELSDTANFFRAKAKDRRAVFEKVANLNFPNNLAQQIAYRRKSTKTGISAAELDLAHLVGSLDHVIDNLAHFTTKQKDWEKTQREYITALKEKSLTFDAEKERKISAVTEELEKFEEDRIKALVEIAGKIEVLRLKLEAPSVFQNRITELQQASRCPQCGGMTETHQTELLQLQEQKITNEMNMRLFNQLRKEETQLRERVNPFHAQLATVLSSENPNTGRIEAEESRVNPYTAELTKLESEQTFLTKKLHQTKLSRESHMQTQTGLDILFDLCATMRGEMLRFAVESIQNATNRYLETYFKAELRVSFIANGSDDLEVTIQKDGYNCSYTQLSKGQRQLLRLTFSVAVMEACSDANGVHFDTLMFDEALDGLDNELKISAYRLFQELSQRHGSVFLIDHNENFQNMFDKRYAVTLEGEYSKVVEENGD